MKQEDLQKLLDSLDEGPLGTRKEHQWDMSNWMKSDYNIAKSATSKEKMSKKAKERCKDGWTSPNRSPGWSKDNPPPVKGGHKGKYNPAYGKGVRYKELTTGFIGTCYDMKQKWPFWMPQMVNRKRIRKDSHYPNKVWIKLSN